jgi:hypothetical protein
VITEEFGLDERFLKVMFFDVSQVGRAHACDFTFQLFDLVNLSIGHTCTFITRPLFIVGYCMLAYQVAATVAVGYLKPVKGAASFTADILLVFEETVALLLAVGGLSFGFYIDLLLISASLYVFNEGKRSSFDNHPK